MSSRLLLLSLAFAGVMPTSCAVGDDPKRTFALPNDTNRPRLVHRCNDMDCRSLGEAELVSPGDSLDFELYFDEDRTYVVRDANADGKTLGCVTVPIAAGTGYYSESLSDLKPCPESSSNNSN